MNKSKTLLDHAFDEKQANTMKQKKQTLEQIRANEIAERNKRPRLSRIRGLIRAACERFDEMELLEIFLEECGALDESDALQVLWDSVSDHDDIKDKMMTLMSSGGGAIVLNIDRLDHQEKLREFLETEIWPTVNEQDINIAF